MTEERSGLQVFAISVIVVTAIAILGTMLFEPTPFVMSPAQIATETTRAPESCRSALTATVSRYGRPVSNVQFRRFLRQDCGPKTAYGYTSGGQFVVVEIPR